MKQSTLQIVNNLFHRYKELSYLKGSILSSIRIIYNTYYNDNKLLVCGNGGSASDSQHIVGELMKSFKLKRDLSDVVKEAISSDYPNDYDFLVDNLQEGLPVISLVGENSLLTAIANDISVDLIFAQQVLNYGRYGDTLLAISTSGKSKNVLYVCKIAKVLGMNVVGLSGEDGGELINLCDSIICVPSNETYIIQEYHLPIYHTICLAIENEFYGE